MLEWYRAKTDYHSLMDDCEVLLSQLAPTGKIDWQGQTINLSQSWERLSVAEAFNRYSETSVEATLQNGTFDEIMALHIEPKLGRSRPTFLLEYPAECAALARRKPDNPAVAERFELYIAGLELANAFSELTDPQEQRARFEQAEQSRREAGKTPYPAPEKFLTELTTMPDSAGIALGIDRLVMLLTDSAAIDEVVAFTPEDL